MPEFKLYFCRCCSKTVSPNQIMCPKHWAMVPQEVLERLRAAKKDRTSKAWVDAVREAAGEVRTILAVRQEYGFRDYDSY